MKVATISEGQTEYACLPLLYQQIAALTGHTLLKPTVAPIPPDAPVVRVAKECAKALKVAAIRRPDLVLLLLDREQMADAPGAIASRIETEIARVTRHDFAIRVVIKDRMFENWLIADPDALAAQPKRYRITEATRRRVSPNRADSVSAVALLKQVALNGQYDKVEDGKRTAVHMDVSRAAKNSRSFRHLLHVLEHPSYSQQCSQPG